MQVNVSLVDSHFIGIPSLGTFTVRGLSGVDLQDLGWHSNGSLLEQTSLVGVGNDVCRDSLQLLNLGGGQSNSDL